MPVNGKITMFKIGNKEFEVENSNIKMELSQFNHRGGSVGEFVEYDDNTEISRIQAEILPVRFHDEDGAPLVGFYICRERGPDRSVVMNLTEAADFIQRLKGIVERAGE